MSRILVVGSNGFIGKPLCAELRKSHFVMELDYADGDIAERSTFERIEPVDHVFHLAGKTYVPDSWSNPDVFIKTNVVGTVNVLEYCRKHSASLTYISAYIYGKPETLPISENHTLYPNNPYALSKHLAELSCEFYSRYHNLKVVVFRPFNVYGPNQNGLFLIPKIIEQVKENVQIEVMDLMPKRDFLYIEDFVDAMIKSINNVKENFCVLNLGSGYSISVKELIDTIQDVAGTNLPVKSIGMSRFEELNDVYCDLTKVRKILKWEPVTTLKIGISNILKVENKQM